MARGGRYAGRQAGRQAGRRAGLDLARTLVGARFMRHTHSFASISAPYSRRLRMPALETTAHVAQRSGLLCAVSGTEASSRFSLVGLGLGLELG